MINRRRFFFATLIGTVTTVSAALAQPGPEPRRDEHPGPDEHRPPERPHMPPPRHEVRSRPPGPESEWHWRDGHWDWNGREWVWIAGRWYR